MRRNLTNQGQIASARRLRRRYILNLLLHNSLHGIAKTYLYNLADAPSGDPHRYGQFNADWTPKASATAIHNLTTILRNAGPRSPLRNLEYRLNGLPEGGHSVLLGGDKAFALVVWNEVTVWDPAAAKDIAASTYTVTVMLRANYRNVAVYDPMTGTTPIVTAASASTVLVRLTDHPLIIWIGFHSLFLPPSPHLSH